MVVVVVVVVLVVVASPVLDTGSPDTPMSRESEHVHWLKY